MLFHGVNMVNKTAPYTPTAAGFSDADAAWLADNGFRVVRVGILGTGLMPTPGVIDTSYVAAIVTTVDTLAKHDVYSLLDFHQDGWGPSLGDDGFPAWATLTGTAMDNTSATFPLYYQQNPALQQAFQSFWDDAKGPDGNGLQEDYAAMFGAVAKQVAGEPHVLGYDLFNEPPGRATPGAPASTTRTAAPCSTRASSARPTRRRSPRSAQLATNTSSSASRSACSTSGTRRRACRCRAATRTPARGSSGPSAASSSRRSRARPAG
jgi:endoglycosylceramidase